MQRTIEYKTCDAPLRLSCLDPPKHCPTPLGRQSLERNSSGAGLAIVPKNRLLDTACAPVMQQRECALAASPCFVAESPQRRSSPAGRDRAPIHGTVRETVAEVVQEKIGIRLYRTTIDIVLKTTSNLVALAMTCRAPDTPKHLCSRTTVVDRRSRYRQMPLESLERIHELPGYLWTAAMRRGETGSLDRRAIIARHLRGRETHIMRECGGRLTADRPLCCLPTESADDWRRVRFDPRHDSPHTVLDRSLLLGVGNDVAFRNRLKQACAKDCRRQPWLEHRRCIQWPVRDSPYVVAGTAPVPLLSVRIPSRFFLIPDLDSAFGRHSLNCCWRQCLPVVRVASCGMRGRPAV